MILIPRQVITRSKNVVARIQTDGSYSYKTRISRTAAILILDNTSQYMFMKTYCNHMNSMESEWASLVDGLEYSTKKGLKYLIVENDCLPVITSIVMKKPPKNALFLEYYNYFNSLTSAYKWLGIRWIPREMNRADQLFRF